MPANYGQFLEQMNGGEGFIGEHYLMLWSVERFVEMNEGAYFAEAAPGLIVLDRMAEVRHSHSTPAPLLRRLLSRRTSE